MTQEEKARAYDQAIINGSRLWECGLITRESYETIFPELRENEDDRIRQTLIHIVKGACGKYGIKYQGTEIGEGRLLSWLEKQGQQMPVDSYCQENCKGFQETGKCFADGGCKAKREAETTDKVEPKFKVGEWIAYNVFRNVLRIVSIDGKNYAMETPQGNTIGSSISYIDSNYHHWTIQDGRPGDVLVNKHGCPLIFKDRETCWCYYSIPCKVFRPNSNRWFFSSEDYLYPASKEQRDLLFQKMREAGYEWDAEKKELKKIEQKPAERSEADDIMRIHALEIIGKYWTSLPDTDYDGNEIAESCYNWLKSLKPQPKQEWGEEDERYLNTTIAYLKDAKEFKKTAENCINWLKSSLRPQPHWNPSDEQKPVDKAYTFKAIPRLLDMLQPTGRAISYCQKLIDSLEQEGYNTDAKIVRGYLKRMNGEKVAMATMDEQQHTGNVSEWSQEDEDIKQSIIDILTRQRFQTQVNWLKSLSQKPHWKPLEEQMCYLKSAYESYDFCDGERAALESLYNDLQKLL